MVGAGVFDLSVVAIIDDEAKLARGGAIGGCDRNVEVNAKTIETGNGDFARTPVIRVGGRVPSVKTPAGVVAIGPIVMNARVAAGTGFAAKVGSVVKTV